ncbi:hypothetical protein [Novipirellula caenicola]|uniref:Squalene cyclase C-terminal domain-containing protein n=1 Tax=Novipirellula caenicola TaxID=1536901 RepID=A0ABP9VPJ3_9BACT
MNPSISRRVFLVSGIAASILGSRVRTLNATEQDEVRSPSQTLIKSLRDYLLAQQSPDGAWRSQTYALLKSGQALTPFVLSILQDCDSKFVESVTAAQAHSWMINHMRNGVLGVADPDVLEYPVFASAFALRCFNAMSDHGAVVDSLRRFLIGEQFTESRGFPKTHLAYGGWGFGGPQPAGQTGHMDLAHTRWVLAALRDSGHRRAVADADSAKEQSQLNRTFANAQHFLRLLQKHPSERRPQPAFEHTTSQDKTQRTAVYDGGFYFSPIVLAANKGRIGQTQAQTFFRSYATATCDGVIALLASGVDMNDERVVAAKKWLQQHDDWEYPDGIPRDYPEPWGEAVYFYHQAVRAEAYWRLGISGDWADQLVDRLRRHQSPDGSIVNRRSGLMKENDPLMCSALALIAAHFADRQLSGIPASSTATR